MNWEKLGEMAIVWGPGFLLAAFILVGLYRIFDKFGVAFIAAQQAQATNMGATAQAMEGLKSSIDAAVARDDNEHKEILIMLKLIWQKMSKEKEEGESGS